MTDLKNVIFKTYALVEDKLDGFPLQLNSLYEMEKAFKFQFLYMTINHDLLKHGSIKTDQEYQRIKLEISSLGNECLAVHKPNLILLGYLYFKETQQNYNTSKHKEKLQRTFISNEQKILKHAQNITNNFDYNFYQKEFEVIKSKYDHYDDTKDILTIAASVGEKLLKLRQNP